jgi:hypothetical protein
MAGRQLDEHLGAGVPPRAFLRPRHFHDDAEAGGVTGGVPQHPLEGVGRASERRVAESGDPVRGSHGPTTKMLV